MRAAGVAAFALLGLAPSGAAALEKAPHVFVVDDGARLRRGDVGSPLSRGEGNPVWRPGSPVRVAALRDEVVALQVVLEAGTSPLADATVELTPLEPRTGGAGARPSVERFVEHYVAVRSRSRNDRRPRESLGWAPLARPADAATLGEVPDALIPIELAKPFCPYPLAIRPGTLGAVWIDVTVPRDALPGAYTGVITVRASGAELARFELELALEDATLPFRPVSFLAYYSAGELADRVGGGDATERQLLQLLHRHQIDAFADLRSPDDAERLRKLLDGSLFTAKNGYVGPGEGVAPAAVALGAYGGLGAPDDTALAKVRAIVPRIPKDVDDVLFYAVDEDCESELGPSWRRKIRATPGLERVIVAHTCERDPRLQDVDLVLTPANRFMSDASREARSAGRRVWVYNGSMPRAGTLLLDGDPLGLRADGWIAATHAIGRWFFWETTFWNDDNSGGHGAVDPFVTPESFHNRDGDRALLDGLLVYPGTQEGRFAAHSLGFSGTVPSIRLKNLRRGIEDAGYFALARVSARTEADAIARRLLPEVLDEARSDAEPSWPRDGAAFAAAREDLRALVRRGATLDRAAVAGVLADAAIARRRDVSIAWDIPWSPRRTLAAAAGAAFLFALVLGAGARAWIRRRSRGKTRARAIAG